MASIESEVRLAACILRGLITIAVCATTFLVLSASSCTANVILTPTSYVTIQGGDGGEPVDNIDVRDESGIATSPARYVQFKAKSAGKTYAGYRTYTLPATVKSGSVSPPITPPTTHCSTTKRW